MKYQAKKCGAFSVGEVSWEFKDIAFELLDRDYRSSGRFCIELNKAQYFHKKGPHAAIARNEQLCLCC